MTQKKTSADAEPVAEIAADPDPVTECTGGEPVRVRKLHDEDWGLSDLVE